MTEHSFPLGDLLNGTPNGADPVTTTVEKDVEAELFASTGVESTESLPLPRVDATRGVFITSKGDEIQLSDKSVNGLVVERLSQEGKPKIPMVEVKLVGGRKQLEPFPGHEGYKAQLAEWEIESRIRILKYLFVVGVKGQPPQEFIDEHYTFFPDSSDLDMKYLWVCSMVPDDDIDAITDAIMGRTLPTTKGVDEVANFTE